MPHWWPYEHRKLWLNDIEAIAVERFKPTENIAKIHGDCDVVDVVRLFAAMPSEWPCPKS